MADYYASIAGKQSASEGDMDGNVQPIGSTQVQELTQILLKYKSAKSATNTRIKASEDWWKLRNTAREQAAGTLIGKDGGFTSQSSWLHNVITSKHADAMDAYPEPIILPREADDKQEARTLSDIVPCILEQNKFKQTYRAAMWRKLKGGTAVYKVIWDAGKLGGLGDISIISVNPLNLYFQANVSNIQDSRYVFQAEYVDKDSLREQFPDLLRDRLKGNSITFDEFRTDDKEQDSDKAIVIECYYKKSINGKSTVQYVKYVEDVVLYATENDVNLAKTGLYEHGKFPYVIDALFPVEGSPFGYGFVDIEQNPQTIIDVLRTAIVKNAMVGSVPRYFMREGGKVNEMEFLDLSKPLVHVAGNLDDMSLRQIITSSLPPIYVNVLDSVIDELRQTSGNTETATGNATSGVTAASAIAALQEASGKGSRDSTDASYDAYRDIIELVIELIRQFYDTPRMFRIVGQYGTFDFISFTNVGIKPVPQGADFGVEMGYRVPAFDISIRAQKQNAYTKMAQNELALQFYSAGFFNPQNVDQALACIDMMDFDGKEDVMQKIARNGTLFDKLVQYMQMSLMLAQRAAPELVQGLAQDIQATVGGGAQSVGGTTGVVGQSGQQATKGRDAGETRVNRARQQSAEASQPSGGG